MIEKDIIVEVEIARLKAWDEYKIEVKKVYEKSQETFEKQLSFLSAGALGFSMFFVEKIIADFKSSTFSSLLIFSWILLGSTLIINLISHLLSARNNYKTLLEIENRIFDTDLINKRIKVITYINWTTIFSLLLGIALFIIFVLYNI